MRLTPREKDKLLVAAAAMVARRRLERGVKLNHPEAAALITDEAMEEAREGASYEQVLARAQTAVTEADLLPGVRELLAGLRFEALLDEGSRVFVLRDPAGGVNSEQ